MTGGKLESNGILDEENIDDDLRVFYVQSKKVSRYGEQLEVTPPSQLFLYHEREPSNAKPKLCLWSTKQRFSIERIAAGINAIVFSTDTGQVYTASLDKLMNVNRKIEQGNSHWMTRCPEKDVARERTTILLNTLTRVLLDSSPASNPIYDERLYQYLNPSPIPLLHRCRAIATDRMGRSLAALQYHPTTQ